MDLPDDLLEQILHRQNPLHPAVLVDDDGQVVPLALHLLQCFRQASRLRQEEGLPHCLGQLEILGLQHETQDILAVDDPDNVVDLIAIDRQA